MLCSDVSNPTINIYFLSVFLFFPFFFFEQSSKRRGSRKRYELYGGLPAYGGKRGQAGQALV